MVGFSCFPLLRPKNRGSVRQSGGLSSTDRVNMAAVQMYRSKARYYRLKARGELELMKQQAAYYRQMRLLLEAQSRAKGLTVPDLPKELAEDTNLLSAFQTSGEAGASSDSECDRLTPSFLR